MLDILWKENASGDCYEVQVNIPNVDARRQPDYAFFRTASDLNNAEARKGTLDYWRDVPALGDAKAWFASLDRQRGVDENPSSQIANYLYRSRVRWGILTNGRIWRLYEREKSSAGGVFFEVDLEDILKRNDPNAFKYFYLFFRREAFLPDAGGVSFIEHVFLGSIEYASEVGDRLKESVYDALRSLMNGFFEHSANALDRNDPETVKLVHDNCLIVLYRLLFLLYAEDGRLLPCEEEPYHSISLLVLHRQINQNLSTQRPYLPTPTILWSHVCNLFRLIDEGFQEHETVIVPAYNGGLFSPSHYPHIAHSAQANEQRWDIGDRHIAEAIDQLAYQRETWDQPGSQDIDYKTLDVRHLGSIYEGLLELQPHVAPEPLIETLDDGKPVFKPAREVPNPRPIRGQHPRTIGTSEIYLTTNRGERKATGSYYTPKYIVDYIVENTVGPLLDEAARKVVEIRPAIQREIRKRERERAKYPSDAVNQIEKSNRAIEEQKRLLLEPYLSLKILDPAMGSGHFLVGAADFLSLAMATDPNLLELDTIGDEDPQAHYKRLVVEHCLYGVDLNLLAVELAKLSLWLHTVSREKALSFLDHHLRCGNSLVGARVEQDLMREPPQFNARGRRINADSRQLVLGFTEALTGTHLNHFLETFSKIVEAPGGTAESERWKDTVYREMDAVRDKFREVAHCWLAPFFGAPVTPQQYQEAVNGLRATIPEWEALKQQEWFGKALAVAGEKRFFHWELEFPEVFFDARGFKAEDQRGFDVVIGNPPYVSVVNIESELREYLLARFETAIGRFDLYITFVERALSLIIEQGMFGFIQPIKFAIFANGRALRDLLLQQMQIQRVVDVSQCQVFPDPTTYPCLPIVKKCPAPPDHHIISIIAPRDQPESISTINDVLTVNAIPQSRFLETPEHVICLRLSDELWNFVKRIEETSEPLGGKFDIEQCIRIGSAAKRRKLVLDEVQYASASEEVRADCKKMLDGENLERYAIAWEGSWLHYLPNELYNPKSFEVLETPKLLIKRIAPSLTVVPDLGKDGNYFYPLNTIYALIARTEVRYSPYYVTALLNSKLLDWYYKLLFEAIAIRGGYIEYREYLKYLPLRKVLFNTDRGQRASSLEKGKRFYRRLVVDNDWTELLNLVEEWLSQDRERTEVVHDLIAFLAEQMITLNQQRLEEAGGFLTWLQRHLAAKIDDLSNKTQVRAYDDGDFSDLLSVLRRNQRRFGKGIDVSNRKFQEELEREFTTSVQKLQPLKANIEATHNLIDEIVFRLYGLTDYEIKLVTGQSEADLID